MADSYRQYCGWARALDVIGDRWTLLIVRELAVGPRRFTDLINGLPGISRNLLAQRLRELERDGVAEQVELPPPAARQAYQLTEDGRDLAEALRPLAAWGARRLGARRPDDVFRPHWAALAMATFADRAAATGVNETYQYVVGDTAFHFIVNDGTVELHEGLASRPAVTVTTDEETWADVASGSLTSRAAAEAGRLRIEGSRDAVARSRRILSRSATFAQMERVARRT